MEKAVAKVLIIMLEARLKAARRFIYNQNMQREGDLLMAEIEALQKFIDSQP